MNKFKSINSFLNIIYIFILISVFFQFVENLRKNFPVEFFINYDDGLIRRGLIGNCLYLVGKYLNLSSTYYVFFFVWGLILLNIIIAVSVFYRYKIEYFFLLTSPMFLNILAKNIPFRLDLVIIPIIFLQLLILKDHNITKIKKIFLTSFIICLGILTHEIYFIISFCITLYIIIYKLNIKKISFLLSIYIIPFLLFIMINTLFKGNEEQINNIILSWNSLNLEASKLEYLKWLFSLKEPLYIWNNSDFINNPFTIIGLILNYLILCALSYLFFNMLFYINKKTKLIILINFGIIILLSIVAEDYIRWFFYMTLINLYYLVIFEKKKDFIDKNFKYLSIKFLFLFIGVPMVKIWSLKLFFWSSPIRNFIFYYYLF